MKHFCLALFVFFLAIPAHAATLREKIDVAAGVTSLSASAVASSLTAVCTTNGSCVEVNPVMRRWIGQSPAKAIVLKASVNGAIHYAVWRFIKPGKLRTATFLVLASVNTWDAGHDLRVLRRMR